MFSSKKSISSSTETIFESTFEKALVVWKKVIVQEITKIKKRSQTVRSIAII